MLCHLIEVVLKIMKVFGEKKDEVSEKFRAQSYIWRSTVISTGHLEKYRKLWWRGHSGLENRD
jgi:hypothetical protein